MIYYNKILYTYKYSQVRDSFVKGLFWTGFFNLYCIILIF